MKENKKPLNKNFLKLSAIAVGLLYAGITILFLYCMVILILPAFCAWLVKGFIATLNLLSNGDQSLFLFYTSFFITCTVLIIILFVVLKIHDFKNCKNEDE